MRHAGLGFLERISRRSYTELFSLWVLLDIGFAMLYLFLMITHPDQSLTIPKDHSLLQKFLDSMYFSTITATTIGYGDMVPLGISKLFAATEGVLAFGTFGVFLTKLVSQRQDAAIHEMHRMAFENIFFNMRHGLFIARKDFDGSIRLAEEGHTFSSRDWQNLISAFLHIESWLEEIPSFYRNDVYSIDPKRERMLFDAIDRTLDRLQALLHAMKSRRISWKSQPEAQQELSALLLSAKRLPQMWTAHGKATFATHIRTVLAELLTPDMAPVKKAATRKKVTKRR